MPDLLDGFIAKKKAESNFLSLEDGESVKVIQLKEIKPITKAGFGGEEKDMLRFKCLVMTSEGEKVKDFDNSTQRFAQELQTKGVTIGSSFVLTRIGVSTKTRYSVSEVSNPGAIAAAAPQPAPAPQTVAPAAAPEVAPVAASQSNTTAPVAP